MEDNTALDKYRRVAHVEEFYEINRDVHEKDVLHGGYKKTNLIKMKSSQMGITGIAYEKMHFPLCLSIKRLNY